MFEKRMYERSPIEMAASYGIDEDPRPEKEAKINNISLGGLCLSMDKQMSIGEGLQLAIELDSKNEAIIYAKVVWIKREESTGKFKVGVQFVDKDSPDFQRFLDYYGAQI